MLPSEPVCPRIAQYLRLLPTLFSCLSRSFRACSPFSVADKCVFYVTYASINKSTSINEKLLVACETGEIVCFLHQKCYPSKNFRAGGSTPPRPPPAKHLHSRLATPLGCVLSPPLFNICFQPLLDALHHKAQANGWSYTLKSNPSVQHDTSAYADDLDICSWSAAGCQTQLDRPDRWILALVPINESKARQMFLPRPLCWVLTAVMVERTQPFRLEVDG